jgi:molecular chaperone GrpE (heat shock protein)
MEDPKKECQACELPETADDAESRAPNDVACDREACDLETASLHEEIETLKREKEEFRSVALEAKADLYNYRNRVEREREKLRRSIAADRAAAFLPVLDNLDRVLQVPGDADVASVLKGVSMVREQFVSVILDMGITRIETVGRPFDPVRHEAVSTESVQQEDRDGIILEEYLAGYASEDRVLRPARVRVGTYVKPQDPS